MLVYLSALALDITGILPVRSASVFRIPVDRVIQDLESAGQQLEGLLKKA